MNNLIITFFGTGQDPRTREDKYLIIFNDNVPTFVAKEEFEKLIKFYATEISSPKMPKKASNDFYIDSNQVLDNEVDTDVYDEDSSQYDKSPNEYTEDEDGAMEL